MFLQPRLNIFRKPSTLLATLLVFSLTACQHSQKSSTVPPPAKESYERQIEEIFALARQDRWEDAQAKADVLRQQAPSDAMVERVHGWVTQSAQKAAEKRVEDKIREVDSSKSVFNPTIPGLLRENKDRGLPASKDIRDTISKIESSPWIPETYGKTIEEKGPLFDLESTKGKMAKVLEKKISVHFDNVPLETIILNLGQTAGINIVADKALPALKQSLSANLQQVELGEFLRYIGRNYELQFQVGDELVWVVDGKDPKRLMEETRFYRLRKGFIMPAEFGAEEAVKQIVRAANVVTETETAKFEKFVNDAAPPQPALEKAIKELFTGTKFFIDYERNIVVARGTEEQLQVMEKIIEEFDRPVQQVLIEARFVTVSKPAFLSLGVLWETDRTVGADATVRRPKDYTGMVASDGVSALGIGIQQTITNVLNSESLSATITALEQSGESQTLSAPRLTVLNNRPAKIADGKVQYYYEEYQVKTVAQQYYTASSFVPSGKPTKITSGAELNVLASISGDGESILLALNPRVNTDVQMVRYATLTDYSSSGEIQSTYDINLPQYRTQELSTRVAVKSGETVVMGGVLERQRSTYVEAVPVLGKLPVIGVLFRRRTEIDTPRYLLIFVTATIVRDSGEFLIYKDRESATSSSAPAR